MIAVAVGLWTLATPAIAQMEIDSVIVTSRPAYSAGTLTDYFIDPEIEGSGIGR